MNRLRAIYDFLLDTLFPPLCISCRAQLSREKSFSGVLCFDCFSSLEINAGFFRIAAHGKGNPLILGAALNYQSETARNLIHSFKYEGYYSLSKPFANLIMRHLRLSGLWNFVKKEKFVLVPVPLHRSRLKYRGYNQSEILAKDIRILSGLEICDVLVRKKKTKEQAEIKDKNDRLKNVRGCFVLRGKEVVAGKNFMIVDDVFTSGATIMEAARILYKNGAKKVIAVTVAKA